MSIRRLFLFLLLAATLVVTAAIPINSYADQVFYTISGRVVDNNGTPLQGVVLNGLFADPTNASGDYTADVEEGWSGIVTPTLDGYTFDPYIRTYTNVDSALVDQDYTAYQIPNIITPNIIVGRNVNMVPYPLIDPDGKPVVDTGDPYLQRQNEPSIAVSTRNPMHLLAAANDYRTVDEPFSEGPLPGIDLTASASGDAWLGIYKSYNGGQSWTTSLLPGYPQDESDEGIISPLKEYSTACDATVRAGVSGLFFTSGIAFNRTKNGRSAIFVARYIDNNTQAMGDIDSIKYLGVNIIDEGTSGQFADKPWIAVDAPNDSSGEVWIEHPGFNDQLIPRFNVYIVYSIFLGDSPSSDHSKIMFAKSTDCGKNFGNPIKLSEDVHVCQGTNIAVSPKDGTIYVVWRQYAREELSVPHAIMMCKSENYGRTFTKAKMITEIDPFDQFTGAKRFRTSTFPALAVDHHGLVYVAWSQRGEGPNGEARIVIKTSMDGKKWSTQEPVDDHEGGGHQFMPSLTCAGGILRVTWYDARKSLGYIDEGGNYIYDPENPEIADPGPTGMPHTIDAWVAQAELAGHSQQDPENPVFTDSTQVSRYLYQVETDDDGHVTDPPVVYQAQFNFPNFPIFMEGEAPFMGDYLDITPAPMFLYDDLASWRFNTGEGAFDPTLSYITFACNRDVIPPRLGFDWTDYWPPGSGACDDWTAGLRNQNIYSAPVTHGIQVGCPVNTKPLGGYRRSFLVFVKNLTDEDKLIRLTIDAPNLNASFWESVPLPEEEYPFMRCESRIVEVYVFPHSSITLTVFVLPYDPDPYPLATFRVNVEEIDGPHGNPTDLKNSVVLNPDPVNTQLIPPLAVEEHTPFIIIEDPVDVDLSDPTMLSAPVVYYPYLEELLNSSNPDIAAPGLRHPGLRHDIIINPGLRHTNIGDIPEGEATDLNWTVTNAGNTTSAYSFDAIAETPPVPYQLLIYRVATTPISAELCQLRAEEHHELLLSVENPGLRHPGLRHPGLRHPGLRHNTFFLAPGETAICTLRLIDPDPAPGSGGSTQEAGILSTGGTQDDFNPEDYATTVAGAAIPQGANPNGFIEVETSLYIIARDLPQGLLNNQYPNTYLEAFGGEPFDIDEGENSNDPNDDIWKYQHWTEIRINGESQLPPDLSFTLDQNYNPIISGTPTYDPDATYPQHYYFTVEVKDEGIPQQEEANGEIPPQQIARRTFSIEIISPNQAPVAEYDEYSVNEDNTLTVSAAAGVLDNDSDADADLLSASLETVPSHGTLTLNSNGSFTYTPSLDFNGDDAFTYRANDGAADSNTATVSITVITVNDAPVAVYDSATTNEDTPVIIDVLANDADVDVTDILSIASVSDPPNGSAVINPSSTVTYSPDPNFNGPDSFTYTISDGHGGNDTATVSVTVAPVNDPPVAMDDSATTDEDTAVIISVLANDSDVDGTGLSIASVTAAAHGTATPSGNTMTYTPELNFNGTDSFKYIITDGTLSSNEATVTIDIAPVNDVPVADSLSVETYGGTSIDITLTASDIENDLLTFSIVSGSGPTNGTLSGTTPSLTYTPDYGYYGSDSFAFVANDGDKDSEKATVTIDVKEVLIATYNNTATSDDEATAIAVNNSGNVFVTGYSFNGTDNDYATLGYDSDLSKLWVNIDTRYNSGGDDHATAIAVDDSGYFYVTGYSTRKETGSGEDFLTIKYDSLGNEVWTARYDGPSHLGDRPSAIAVDSEENVYVTGYTYRGNKNQHADFSTVKYDSTGKLIWDVRYDARKNGNDIATAIAVDATGVYVTGRSELDLGGSAELHYDYYTVKYNTIRGRKIWDARYNGPGNGDDEATDIAILKDSSGNVINIYVTGKSYGGDPLTEGTGFDYATIKYNPINGNPEWSGDAVRYNGSGNGNDAATAIAANSSGVYVTGYSLNGSDNDYATIKYDFDGIPAWSGDAVTYNGPGNGNDEATAIALDSSGVYVTGKSQGNGTNYDCYTVKYDSSGNVIWFATYNSPGNGDDEAAAIAVNSSGVYVTGRSDGFGTGFDYVTIKYIQ